jgi:hypothetical protein
MKVSISNLFIFLLFCSCGGGDQKVEEKEQGYDGEIFADKIINVLSQHLETHPTTTIPNIVYNNGINTSPLSQISYVKNEIRSYSKKTAIRVGSLKWKKINAEWIGFVENSKGPTYSPVDAEGFEAIEKYVESQAGK